MSPIEIVLLLAALVLIVGCSPRWPYSQSWGWGAPSLGVLLLIVFAVLVYLGRIHLHVN